MAQITLKDIAKALNLSPSTVSRAMKDNPAISVETRRMVKEYAKEHRAFYKSYFTIAFLFNK